MGTSHRYWANLYFRLRSPDTLLYLELIRKALKHLPGITERLCYGTPAFYVSKKIFSRLKEDCETLVIQSFEREKWMKADQATFFITDHYFNYGYMLIRLKTVSMDDLRDLLITAWHNRAPQKLIKEYGNESNLENKKRVISMDTLAATSSRRKSGN